MAASIAVLVLLVAVQVAAAHRAPSAPEAVAISRALHSSPATRAVHCFHVRRIVIATGGRWARANTVPCNRRQFDSALAVLQRRNGAWRVRDLGTAGVGCTVAPATVRRDLGLVCP